LPKKTRREGEREGDREIKRVGKREVGEHRKGWDSDRVTKEV
jgi:hypothetical protein